MSNNPVKALGLICSKCEEKAAFVPKICVPAKDWPIDMRQPVASVINLPLCEPHMGEIVLGDLLNDKFKSACEYACKGRQPPDFDRAWLQKLSVNSPEYLKFVKMAEGQKP